MFTACKQIYKATDVITKPTAREVYERSFDTENTRFLQWQAAYEKAKNDSLKIELPYTEFGLFASETFPVYAYTLPLQEGEVVYVVVEKPIDSLAVFIDLFQQKGKMETTLEKLKSNEPDTKTLSFSVKESAQYLVIIQPQMEIQVPFTLKIYTQPSYLFPVAGATNKNMQSFWGAQRDAGRRAHEGIDIFSPRGTPVVAATDGRVSSTGERGLGGKQVWLRDGLLGKSLYYAHLDSIAVASGTSVKTGDTLGFVGNTGNARTTSPHLHFGIYKGYSGAINPLPFIKTTNIPVEEGTLNATKAVTTQAKATLRTGAGTSFDKLLDISKNDTVQLLGKTNTWYHITVGDTITGFMHQSLLKELP